MPIVKVKVKVEAVLTVDEERWDARGLVDCLNSQGIDQGIYDLNKHHLEGTITATLA